jgi:AcrR family transcriptional regulator
MPLTTLRADAQRNYALILATAEREVAEHGADISLERIARIAGVGSATVRRRFPSRRALLEAVFQERIDALCALAAELGDARDARSALIEWLDALASYAASARGMAATLIEDGATGADAAHVNACSAKLGGAAQPLVRRAVSDGAVSPDVSVTDLIALVTGITLATEHHADPAAEAHRLLNLTIAGVSPRG